MPYWQTTSKYWHQSLCFMPTREIVIRKTLADKIIYLLRETSTFHKVFYPQMIHVVCQSYKTVPSFPISYSNLRDRYRKATERATPWGGGVLGLKYNVRDSELELSQLFR